MGCESPDKCDADHCPSSIRTPTISAVPRGFQVRRQFGLLDCSLARVVAASCLVAISLTGRPITAQHVPPSASQTTVVLFAERPMSDTQWADLFFSMRSELTDGDAEMRPIMGTAEIIRGDRLQPGIRVETAVVVYLHGDCSLDPLVRRAAFGVPLGWVHRRHGRIEPFVHVDCTRIGQVLGSQVRGMKRDQRMRVMAGAIARVTLHEWIHIATQSTEHAESGVAKAQFGVADLMAGGR